MIKRMDHVTFEEAVMVVERFSLGKNFFLVSVLL